MPRALSGGMTRQPGLLDKFLGLHWILVLVICCIAIIGFAMLYSSSQGDFGTRTARQMIYFGVGLVLMTVVALVHIRLVWQMSYVIYGGVLLLLVGVEVIGQTGGGATRWLELGPLRLQPSEIMKLALVMALARYYHGLSIVEVAKYRNLMVPLFLIAAPAALVIRQPDLGTTLLLAAGGVTVMFLAGVPRRVFAVGAIGAIAAGVVGYYQLRDYQKKRILTFLDPGSDPLGAGYHIQQSKIALGSGGVTGKGFGQGTQAHLDFLPEKQTDFIFTVLAEEFGFIGAVTILALYTLVIIYGFIIALTARSQFSRLLALGVTTTFFLYVFINIAMVMGLIPVVGVPLPLVSYGGSAVMTLMLGMGLLMCVHVHKYISITRQGHSRA
ncbi:MAG: rod shape-determining protein RodA [Alphaproteobacteria bacterium]